MRKRATFVMWCLSLLAATSLQADNGMILTVNFTATGMPGISDDSDSANSQPLEIPLETAMSGASLLDLMNKAHTAPTSRPKITNGKLFGSIVLQQKSEDAKGLMLQEIATCKKIDLFAETAADNNMVAQCDADLFRFRIIDNRIVFLRNENEEVAHLNLTPGIYLINGGLIRLPAH